MIGIHLVVHAFLSLHIMKRELPYALFSDAVENSAYIYKHMDFY